MDTNQTLTKIDYLKLVAKNNICVAIGSSIVGRATDAKLAHFEEGATGNFFSFPLPSFALEADLTLCEKLKIPFYKNLQKMTVTSVPELKGDLVFNLFPENEKFFLGILGENQQYTEPTDDYTMPSSAGAVAVGTANTGMLTSYASLSDSSTFQLLKGWKIGNEVTNIGAAPRLGDFLTANPLVRDGAKYIYSGVAGNLGPESAQTPISNIIRQQGDNSTGSGFGVPDSGDDDESRLQSLLNMFRLKTTVTISPFIEDVTSSFTILAGTKWIGDDMIYDKVTGLWYNLHSSDLQDATTGNDVDLVTETFLNDVVISSDRFSLSEAISLSNDDCVSDVLRFNAGEAINSYITVNTVVNTLNDDGEDNAKVSLLAAYNANEFSLILPTGSGSGIKVVSLVGADGDTVLESVMDGSDVDYNQWCASVTLSEGAEIHDSLTLNHGMVTYDGFVCPEGSNTAEAIITGENHDYNSFRRRFRNNHGDNFVVGSDFGIWGDFKLTDLACTSRKISIPSGAVSSLPQAITKSSSWDLPISIPNSFASAGHVAQSYIEFLETQILESAVECSKKSVVAAGSTLFNVTTAEGMRATEDILITASTVTEDTLDICETPTVIDSISAETPLVENIIICDKLELEGQVFKTSFKTGTQVTNGNHLPFDIKVLPSENYVLKANTELGNVIFGPRFVMSNMLLGKNFELPVSSVLSPGVILVANTVLVAGHKFDSDFPFPKDHIIGAGDKINVGTIFRPGAALPLIRLLPQLDSMIERVNSELGDVPFLIVKKGSEPYLVFDKGVVFNKGFVFSEGFTLLPESGFAKNAASDVCVHLVNKVPTFGAGVVSEGEWVEGTTEAWTLDVGAYYYGLNDDSTPTNDVYNFHEGVPVRLPITCYLECKPPQACAMPLNDSPLLLANIDFAVPFIIGKVTSSSEDVRVLGENSVFNPANSLFVKDVTLSSDYELTSSVTLTKKIIVSGGNSVSRYDETILSNPNATITCPQFPFSSVVDVKVGNTDLHVSPTGSKSWIELKHGTLVNFDRGYFTLKAPTELKTKFQVEEPMTVVPSFLAAGIVYPPSAKLLGDISIPAGSSLPGGIPLNVKIVLSHDYVVENLKGKKFVLPKFSKVAVGTSLTKGSVMTEGGPLRSIRYGPVDFWRDSNLSINPRQNLPEGLEYNFFANNLNPVMDFYLDYDSEIESIKDALSLIKGFLDNLDTE